MGRGRDWGGRGGGLRDVPLRNSYHRDDKSPENISEERIRKPGHGINMGRGSYTHSICG